MKDTIQYKFNIDKNENTLELEVCENIDNSVLEDKNCEFKKISIDDFEGEHKCPRCGFEWND